MSSPVTLDRVLKLLGIAWSIVTLVVAAAFFIGGEWQQWQETKAYVKAQKDRPPASGFTSIDTSQFVRYGEEFQLKTNVGFLAGSNHPRPEVQVTISPTPALPWQIQRQKQ